MAQGRGARVYARAGSATVLTPVSEVFAALERGVIDAAELVGPHDDMKLGLHRTARYYYYPGWQEPGATSEFGFNKKSARFQMSDYSLKRRHCPMESTAATPSIFHSRPRRRMAWLEC